MDTNNMRSPLETAYSYVATKMRTSAEVRRKLEEKGFGAQDADPVIRELEELGYLNDYQYALRYFEYNRDKKRGIRRAERALRDKGVDEDIIRNAEEDFTYTSDKNEFDIAMAAAAGEAGLPSRSIDEKMIGSIGRKLENRGFSYDVIFKVLEELRRDK